MGTSALELLTQLLWQQLGLQTCQSAHALHCGTPGCRKSWGEVLGLLLPESGLKVTLLVSSTSQGEVIGGAAVSSMLGMPSMLKRVDAHSVPVHSNRPVSTQGSGLGALPKRAARGMLRAQADSCSTAARCLSVPKRTTETQLLTCTEPCPPSSARTGQVSSTPSDEVWSGDSRDGVLANWLSGLGGRKPWNRTDVPGSAATGLAASAGSLLPMKGLQGTPKV